MVGRTDGKTIRCSDEQTIGRSDDRICEERLRTVGCDTRTRHNLKANDETQARKTPNFCCCCWTCPTISLCTASCMMQLSRCDRQYMHACLHVYDHDLLHIISYFSFSTACNLKPGVDGVNALQEIKYYS